MAKTILIKCKCGCIINQADGRCDLCKIKFKIADKKRKAKSYVNKKVSPQTEDYERLAKQFEGN